MMVHEIPLTVMAIGEAKAEAQMLPNPFIGGLSALESHDVLL